MLGDGRKRFRYAFLLLLAAVPASGFAATGSVTVQTRVVHGIGINKNSDLLFGDFMPPLVASTVNVNSGGTRTAPAAIVLIGGIVSAASFTVRSQGGGSGKFWIEVPASVTLTGSNGGSMTITNMNTAANVSAPVNCVSQTAASPAGPKSSCPAAPYDFTLGGQLNVGANQTPGAYSGTFPVTVTMW